MLEQVVVRVEGRAHHGHELRLSIFGINIDCLTSSSGCRIQFDTGGRTTPLPPGQSCFISMSISLSTLLPHGWTISELVGSRNARQWIDGFLSERMEVLPHLEVRLWCWKSELVATKRSGLREIMTSSITSTSLSPKPSPYIWMESLLTVVSIVIRACQPNRLVTATPLTLPNLDGQSNSFPIVSFENDSKPKKANPFDGEIEIFVSKKLVICNINIF